MTLGVSLLLVCKQEKNKEENTREITKMKKYMAKCIKSKVELTKEVDDMKLENAVKSKEIKSLRAQFSLTEQLMPGGN